MGFRNTVLTAEDPTARQLADSAAEDAAAALYAAQNGIIPGSRLAADAIDGRTISGVTITGSKVRAEGTGDVTLTSTGHALQAGPTNGLNIAMDGDEIMARDGSVPGGVGRPVFSAYGWAIGADVDFSQVHGSLATSKFYVDSKTTDGGWVNVTPATGWTGTFRARRVNAGPWSLVEVRADLSGGSAPAGAFTIVGTLPAANSAPAGPVIPRGMGLTNGGVGVPVYVTTAGAIGFVNDTGATRTAIALAVVYLVG